MNRNVNNFPKGNPLMNILKNSSVLAVVAFALFYFPCSVQALDAEKVKADVERLKKNLTQTYTSPDSFKTMGLAIKMQYPPLWELKKPRQETVIQDFRGPKTNDILPFASLAVNGAPMRFLRDVNTGVLTQSQIIEKYIEYTQAKGEVFKQGSARLDSKLCVWFLSKRHFTNKYGRRIWMYTASFVFFCRSSLVTAQFGYAGQNQSDVELLFNTYLPLFDEIVQTVKITQPEEQ